MADLVKVAQLGSRVVNLRLEDATVHSALKTAGITTDGMEARVNGEPASMDTPLHEGDVVTLVPQIKGGR